MKLIRSYAALLAAVMLPLILGSCRQDGPQLPDTPGDENKVFQIRFQVATRPVGITRADEFTEQEGTAPENFLAIGNIHYYLFDKDMKFLTDMAPQTKITATNASYTLYDVVAEVYDDYFYDNVDKQLDFYILVLANYRSWGVTFPTLARGTDMADLFADGCVMNAVLHPSQLTQPVTNGTSIRFPMAGLQRFSFHGSMLLTTDAGLPYDITLATGKRVNLLRALAKIEIIDKINVPAGEVYDAETQDGSGFRIADAQLNGVMSAGSILPSFNQWYTETQQVETATIPSSAVYRTPPALYADNTFGSAEGLVDYSVKFTRDAAATALREDKCPVWSCYVYEYSKRPVAQVPVTQQPYFIVQTKGQPATETTPEVEAMTLPLRMAQYTDGTATSATNLDNLLRNYIYRFEITGIGQDIRVNWTVCPMDEASAEIEFN